jgi:hypothetical protein
VPPDKAWDVDLLVRRLLALQLKADTQQGVVRVRQGPYAIREFPFLWRLRVYEPEVLVTFFTGNFLYNAEVVTDLDKFPTEEDVKKIEIGLRDCGFVLMGNGDLDLEYWVAQKNFSNQAKLSVKFEELRRLEELKMALVAHQEFEKASKVRDQQDSIRARIDSEALTQFLRD